MDDDVDIYDDLPSFNINECPKCKERTDESSEKDVKLQEESLFWKTKCETYKKEKEIILANSSSLMKTARAEIARKDRIILELRQELEDLKFRRGVFRADKNHTKDKKTEPVKKRFMKEKEVIKRVNDQPAWKNLDKEEEEEEDDSPEQQYNPNIPNSTLYGERLRKKLMLELEAERKQKEELKKSSSSLVAPAVDVKGEGGTRTDKHDNDGKRGNSKDNNFDSELKSNGDFNKNVEQLDKNARESKNTLADDYYCSGTKTFQSRDEVSKRAERNSRSRELNYRPRGECYKSSEKNDRSRENNYSSRRSSKLAEENYVNSRRENSTSRDDSNHGDSRRDSRRYSREASSNSRYDRRFRSCERSPKNNESERRSSETKRHERGREDRYRNRDEKHVQHHDDLPAREKYESSGYSGRASRDRRTEYRTKNASESKNDRESQRNCRREDSSKSKKADRRTKDSRSEKNSTSQVENKEEPKCDDKRSLEKITTAENFDFETHKTEEKNSIKSDVQENCSNFQKFDDESKNDETQENPSVDAKDKFIMMLENDSDVAMSPFGRQSELEQIGSRSFREEKIENIEKFIQEYDYSKADYFGNKERDENKSANSTGSIVDTLSMDDINETHLDKLGTKENLVTSSEKTINHETMKEVCDSTMEVSKDTTFEPRLEIVEAKAIFVEEKSETTENEPNVLSTTENLVHLNSVNIITEEKSNEYKNDSGVNDTDCDDKKDTSSEKLENLNTDFKSDKIKVGEESESTPENEKFDKNTDLVATPSEETLEETFSNENSVENAENEKIEVHSTLSIEKSVELPLLRSSAISQSMDKEEPVPVDKKVLSKPELQKNKKLLLKELKNRPRIPCFPIVSLYSGKRRNLVLVDSPASQTTIKPLFPIKNADKESPINFESALASLDVKTSLESPISTEMREKEFLDEKGEKPEIKKSPEIGKMSSCEISKPEAATEVEKKLKEQSPILSTLIEKQIDIENKCAESNNGMENDQLEVDSKKRAAKNFSNPSKSDVPGTLNRKRPLSIEKENQAKPSKNCRVVATTRRRPVQLVDSSTVTTLVSSERLNSSENDLNVPVYINSSKKRRVVDTW